MTKKRFAAILILVCTITLLGFFITIYPNLARNQIISIAAKSPPSFVASIGSDASDSKQILVRPLDVWEHKGVIYALDGASGSIKAYDGNGRYIKEIKIKADNGDESVYPVSITFDKKSETFFVAEINSQRIGLYGLDGKIVGHIPNEDGYLIKPIAVAIADHKLYVADAGKQVIKVFDLADKDLVMEFGAKGSSLGQLLFPTGIAVKDNGDICVADSNNKRIQIFDPKGHIKEVIRKSKSDYFVLPRDLAVDGQGYIHVVDTFRHNVAVFNVRGDFVYSYGGAMMERGSLEMPSGIYIDWDDFKIYIADQGTKQVIVYGYEKV